MKLKKALSSILAIAMILSTMSFTAFAAGDATAENAVASIGDRYYSTVALAMADADANDIIIIHKDINDTFALTAPTVAPLTFKAAIDGIKITGRALLPQTAIAGAVTYDGFDFTGNTDWTVYQWDGPEKLADLELVFKNCEFGAKGICIGYDATKPDWNLKKLTIDNCKASDAKEVFSLQYVNEVVIENCDFSNATDRLINVSAASGNVTVSGSNFGSGSVQLSQNVGTEERNLTVENSTFTGDKAVVIHENLTNASTPIGTVELTGNTVEETTEIVNFKDDSVEAVGYLASAVVTFSGNKTVDDVEVKEISNGCEVVEGTIVPKVDVTVDSTTAWSAAINNATDVNEDGIITYGVSGKVTVDATQIKGAAENIYIIGLTEDAELCVDTTGNGNFYIKDNTIKTVNFVNITLSRLNGSWAYDVDNTNKFFTVWTVGSKAEQVNYTNCVFPNGSAAAYPGKTVYTNCDFTNNTDTNFGVWVYAKGETVITGCEFTGNAGVKTYGYAGQTEMNTVIEDTVFNVTEKPAVVVSGLGTVALTDVDVDNCTYGVWETAVVGGNMATVTLDGVAPTYVAQCQDKYGSTVYVTNADYAESVVEEANSTTNSPVDNVVKIVGEDFVAYYASLDAAIEAAEDGDTITLLEDNEISSHIQFSKNITIDLDGNTLNMKAEPNTAGFYPELRKCSYYITADVTFANGTMVVSNTEYASHGNFFVEVGDSLTFDGVELTTNGINAFALIQTYGNLEFVDKTDVSVNNENSTFVYSEENLGAVNVDDSAITLENVNGGITGSGIGFNATESEITMTNVGGNGLANVNGTVTDTNISITGAENGIKNTIGTLDVAGDSNITVADSTEYDIKLGATAGLDVADTATVNAEIYIEPTVNPDGTDNLAETVKLTFEATDKQGVYNIYVEATEAGKTINRLSTVQGTFALDNDRMSYTLAPVDGVQLTNDIDTENVYVFNFNGENAPDASGAKILIGTVTFGGYGKFNFTVTDGKVKTALLEDNIVSEYIPNGDTTGENAKQGNLDLNESAITGAEVVEAKRDVKVVISFNNELGDVINEADYNDMTVTLTGANGEEHIAQVGDMVDVLDADGNVTGQAANYTAEKAEMTFNVTAGYRYTVVVSGAGYRTARYTTIVDAAEDTLVLNFWNNALENADRTERTDYIEAGVDRSLKSVTFLAGDIAEDNIIDKYDLAAVVSYFGKYNLKSSTETYKYARYDLNRDGKIDSDDIAYVLASWNK